MRRLDPAYRACFADGSTILVRSRPRGDARRDRPDLRQRGRGRVRRLRRLAAASCTRSRCRTSSTATTTPRSACSARPAAVAQLLRLGAFGRLGAAVRRRFRDPRLHRLFSFQAMYAGLAPDDALALYAVITYMDSIEGVYFPEGGMHAMPVAHGPGGGEGRGHLPLRRRGRPSILRSPHRPGRRRADRVRRADRGRRRGLHPRPAGRVRDSSCPTCGRRGRSGTVATRRRRWSGTSAYAGVPEPPVAHHNIHFGDRVGRGVRRPARARRADARPVAAGHRAVAGRADRGAGRLARRCTCWSRCPT